MTNCSRECLSFSALNRRKIEAEFSGGDITSDGGVLLLRQMDRQLGLMTSIDHILHDPREQDQVTHSQISLLRQRVYGLCLAYEELNDHQPLRTIGGQITTIITLPASEIIQNSHRTSATRIDEMSAAPAR